jgi:hypothetical protein
VEFDIQRIKGFCFVSKASTLRFLESTITSAKILPQVQINYAESHEEKEILDELERMFSRKNSFIIRSSHSSEDRESGSHAGKYLSLLNISWQEVFEGVSKVFSSYGENKRDEIVFIQPYLRDTIRSGVVFTHSPHNGQPYLIDNYVKSSDTGTITSGAKHGFKHVCLRSSKHVCGDEICFKLRSVIEECEKLLSLEFMDIEYAISNDNELVIFQVRPLKVPNLPDMNVVKALEDSSVFIRSKSKKTPFLAGETTIFGVMPDWNPAEMIGRRPKRLALSLYRELITDSIWAYQRDNYGYKSLRSFPLLVEIGGQPFIDTRVSFNSLLPKGLSGDLENQLVNYYLAKLSENRNLHDKVEFEIVLSSWTFDIDKRLSQLPSQISSLQKESLKETLTSLTRNVVLGNFVDSDINRVSKMIQRKKTISAEKGDNLSELYWLLEDCKRWGTLPFAGLARAAFIATQVLKSLEVVTGKHDILAGFIAGLDTVTSQMSRDVYSLNKDSFLEKYGHLRPGTYDITSRSYREAFDIYFGDLIRQEEGFEAKEDNHRDLESLLEESGIFEQLGVRAQEFLDFARRAVYWREQAKFEFTKNLSGVLDLIQTIGSSLEINREDLAFLDVRVLTNAYSSSFNLGQEIQKSIEKGKVDYHDASVIELPSVIRDESEIFSFTEEDASPNFITSGSVAGVAKSKLENLSGHIALIEGADPGYDWIFQKGITGLITAYGGANSHMAVRCSELNLPAAIGVGDRLFKELKNAFHVNLDCGNRIIEYR